MTAPTGEGLRAANDRPYKGREMRIATTSVRTGLAMTRSGAAASGGRPMTAPTGERLRAASVFRPCTGKTDCHASDIGHWLAMTRLQGWRIGRAADDRPYERERRADVGIGPYGRGFAGGR